MRKQHASLYLLLVALLVVIATWSTLLLTPPGQRTIDQRVMDVAAQLKCVVCQGESVADSQAALAQQMRLVIQNQLQAGKSEQEVIHYFEERYGAEIVWSPAWQGFGLLAWLIPILFWSGGIALVVFLLREWQQRSLKSVDSSNIEMTRKEQEADQDDYRTQLEAELAEEDALFRQVGREEK